jgi:hypothetical protein
MKMAFSMALSQEGSGKFQNPFFSLILDMETASVLNFMPIGPSLRV